MCVLGAVVLSLSSSFLVYASVFGCGSFRHSGLLSTHAWSCQIPFYSHCFAGKKCCCCCWSSPCLLPGQGELACQLICSFSSAFTFLGLLSTVSVPCVSSSEVLVLYFSKFLLPYPLLRKLFMGAVSYCRKIAKHYQGFWKGYCFYYTC